jgi:hypothetical protein
VLQVYRTRRERETRNNLLIKVRKNGISCYKCNANELSPEETTLGTHLPDGAKLTLGKKYGYFLYLILIW